MSELVSIQVEQRTVIGRKVKQLRREGWVPAVIYGQTDPIAVQVDRAELRRALRQAGMTDLIEVNLGSDQRTVLARDIQQHVTRGDILHVDFFEVNLRQIMSMDVTLTTTGNLPGSLSALGTVSLVLQSVHLEALPADLPSEIEVDISQIKDADDAIYVRDLPVPAGVTILTDPDALVTSFSYARTEEAEEEEEEDMMFAPSADGVEVIGRAKEEEDF